MKEKEIVDFFKGLGGYGVDPKGLSHNEKLFVGLRRRQKRAGGTRTLTLVQAAQMCDSRSIYIAQSSYG